MKRLFVCALIAAVAGGCATTRLAPVPDSSLELQESDLIVAGWRIPFECLELSERIEASQARLYESSAGTFSTARSTDERRLRSLESRADSLGCLLPGSPFAY